MSVDVKRKNLEYIKGGFPELYARLVQGDKAVLPENFSENDASPEDFTVIENMETLTEVGAVVAELPSGEVVRLNSAYDPEHEARVWAQGQENLEAENILLFGLGNGSFARAVLAAKKKDSRVLIYEPSARLFHFALSHYDLSGFFGVPGVRVIVEGVNEDMVSGVMEEMLTLENFESRSFLVSPGMGQWFPAARKRFVGCYMDGVGRLMSNKNTTRRFIHLSPYNQLHNLIYLEKHTVVPKLAKVWEKDVPVIVIGAGPSLKEETEVLKRERDRAFLFAVDSALPFLLEKNIVPDAYICIEADKPLSYFEGEQTKEIPLFCRVNTTHKLLDKHQGAKVFGWDEGLPGKLYEKYGVPVSQYRYGGNGATSFFAICKEMGVKTVILLGQDMAYGADKASHVGGRNERFVENRHFLFENNLGESVQSRQDWYRFVRWYENAIPACGFDHVINTAARGVRIKGTEFMSLEQALERYGKKHEPVEKLIEKAAHTFEGGRVMELPALYQEFGQELEKLQALLDKEPKSEERKKFLIYELLALYEMADMEEDFVVSQRKGMEKIREFLADCEKEVQEWI